MMGPFELQVEAASSRLPVILQGLAAEARKAGSFDEFRQDYLRQIKHGLYWHTTDDPNFRLDLKKGPRDRSSLSGSDAMAAGKFMVTSDLSYWKSELKRPYAALIDMRDVPRTAYRQVSRGFGNEFWVDDPSKAKVLKVLPINSAMAFDRKQSKFLPNSDEALKAFYDEATR